MELNDLKLAWQELDRKLERQYSMDLLRLREERGQRIKSGLRPLAWGQALQMAFGVMCVILGSVFGLHYLGTAHLFAFGLIVGVYGIALIACGGAMQALLADNDYTAPVVTIQKRLARLRETYVRSGLAVGLVWWLLWMPFLSVLMMTFFGVDLFRNAPAMFAVGGAIGVAGLLGSWGLYRWSRQPGRPRLAKWVDDSVTGASLLRAQAVLEEIKRFERE